MSLPSGSYKPLVVAPRPNAASADAQPAVEAGGASVGALPVATSPTRLSNMFCRLFAVAAATAAVFYPASPPRPSKRDAATSIGDGSVGSSAGANEYRPTDDDDDDAIATEEAKTTRLLPQLEEQISYEVDRFPRHRGIPTPVLYKHGAEGYTPEEYAARFPPGLFYASNPLSVNTSQDVRPSLTRHVLRGVEICFARPELNRFGDKSVDAALCCTVPGCGGRLNFVRWSTSQAHGETQRFSGRFGGCE